jgi:hypothetical protein
MEQLLLKIEQLEKRVALLENKGNTQSKEINDFKETIKLISVNSDNLINIFNTSIDAEIIKILLELNIHTPFLQYKKHVFKLDNGNMIKVEDDDYKYMFEYVEYLIIKEFHTYSLTLKSDDFFEKNKLIYSLNLSKNLKKVKSLFLQSL